MFETIVIVYILGNLLSSRIFSFNKFVNNLDITKVLENFTLYSEFLNENNDHDTFIMIHLYSTRTIFKNTFQGQHFRA